MHIATNQGVCSIFNKDSVVSGHHVCKIYWTPVIGVELTFIANSLAVASFNLLFVQPTALIFIIYYVGTPFAWTYFYMLCGY